MKLLLGIDIGDTFTDFVLYKDGQLIPHKILSTPQDPSKAISIGINDLHLHTAYANGQLEIIYGNTVATTHYASNANNRNVALSSPESVINAAKFLTQPNAQPNLLIFDMGGKLTHASVNQRENVTYHTISLGGNTVASIQKEGGLQVGPLLAGLPTGPACYGFGGVQPTLTDANLILGKIRNCIFSENIHLDINAARMAMSSLAYRLQMRIEDIAQHIIDITNKQMANSLLTSMTESGIDPAQFKLCSVGGAGGLHVCAVADALNIKHIIIPKLASVFSAFGMLVEALSQYGILLPAHLQAPHRATHERVQLHGIQLPVTVWNRDELSPDDMVTGPAIIADKTTSTWLQSGWMAYVDSIGNLLLKRMII
jgi:N-methylhydantoinase A/oxoprolinase/acetone carboxylase beta subunit